MTGWCPGCSHTREVFAGDRDCPVCLGRIASLAEKERNDGIMSDYALRTKARDEAWRAATAEAVRSGIGRMQNMDCAVVSGEKLYELQEKARKWDAVNAHQLVLKERITVVPPSGPVKWVGHGPDPRIEQLSRGLRAQPGKYTEPGNVVIYCDNGNDE